MSPSKILVFIEVVITFPLSSVTTARLKVTWEGRRRRSPVTDVAGAELVLCLSGFLAGFVTIGYILQKKALSGPDLNRIFCYMLSLNDC